MKGQIPFQMPVVAMARWWHADVTCLDWDGAFALGTVRSRQEVLAPLPPGSHITVTLRWVPGG